MTKYHMTWVMMYGVILLLLLLPLLLLLLMSYCGYD